MTPTHLRFVATDTEWMTNGACRGAPPSVFFIERGRPAATARAICATCPVATECLDYALTHRIREGVWGGLDERQRRPLYRHVPPASTRRPEVTHGTTTRYQHGCRCDGCREANRRAAAGRDWAKI